MKKSLMLVLCSSLLILSACGNDEDTVNNTNHDTTTEQNNTVPDPNTNTNDGTTTQNESNTTLPFSSFNLDVDYANFQSFEVEYEDDVDETEAKIEDELNNKTIRGDEAYQELLKHFDQFKFDQNSSTDEVIQEVLESFNLKSDFQKFELEITFSDGTEKEYHLVK